MTGRLVHGRTARRWAAVGVFGVVGAVAATRLTGLPLPPCPLWTLTGVECPGCGSARSVTALLSGDVVAAFSFNLLVPVALAVLTAAALVPTTRFGSLLSRRRSAVVVAGAVGVFWAARLVPVSFLDLLRANR